MLHEIKVCMEMHTYLIIVREIMEDEYQITFDELRLYHLSKFLHHIMTSSMNIVIS
jgi:hypothetical protein